MAGLPDTDDIATLAPAAGVLSFAGLALDRPRVMGIVNVTPDSFSDGGLYGEADTAIAHGRRLLEEGADILDIGGESTRPGAAPLAPEVETARIIPVIRTLAGIGALVSVDTRHAVVMRAAIEAGARIVNDVTALTGDAGSLAAVRDSGSSVVLMHMLGDPQTMQINPTYVDVVSDVSAYLGERVGACRAAGIATERIAIDPGIGFGKTVAHNLALLAGIGKLNAHGVAVLVGASRKSFIGKLSRGEPAPERVAGSVAAALASIARGAHIVRVHDVAATRQALNVWTAVAEHG
jgi:dihydropteroate synthase